MYISGLSFAPALAVNNGFPSPAEHSPASVLDILTEPLLMAVQRNRRTVERRRVRRFAQNRMEDIKLKTNIVVCLNCGEHHEKDTICGMYERYLINCFVV